MTINSKSPLELFQTLGDNITALTLARARELIAPDFVLREPEGHPYGGNCHGPEGFVARMARIRAFAQLLAFEMDCLLDDGLANILFHGRICVTTPSGREELPVMERWRFADDRLAELVMCWHDPVRAGEVLRGVGMGGVGMA